MLKGKKKSKLRTDFRTLLGLIENKVRENKHREVTRGGVYTRKFGRVQIYLFSLRAIQLRSFNTYLLREYCVSGTVVGIDRQQKEKKQMKYLL